jgi:hypothetical protein
MSFRILNLINKYHKTSALLYHPHRGGDQSGDIGGVAGQDHGTFLASRYYQRHRQIFGYLRLTAPAAFTLNRVATTLIDSAVALATTAVCFSLALGIVDRGLPGAFRFAKRLNRFGEIDFPASPPIGRSARFRARR